MVPHISFSEMLGSAAVLFGLGMLAGAYLYHRLTKKA